MELSNDNLIIITDLPACQMHPAQLTGSVVLALCAPVFCFVVRPQQSERTTAVAKTKWVNCFMDSCCHSAEHLHRRHPPGIVIVIVTPPNSSFRDPGQVAEHIESSCKCYTTWEENGAGLKQMAAFTTIQVGQDNN